MCTHQVGKSPFKSLAEKVREFQAKTPVRFKTKPTKPAASKQQHAAITRAEVRSNRCSSVGLWGLLASILLPLLRLVDPHQKLYQVNCIF
jgi:hypothetical protein